MVATEISSKEKHFQVGLGEELLVVLKLLSLLLLSSMDSRGLAIVEAPSSRPIFLNENKRFKLSVLRYFIVSKAIKIQLYSEIENTLFHVENTE